MLVALLFLCLSATAQTEYSGIAGASPRLVRAAKQAANKQANHSSKPATTATASKPKTANEGKVNSKNAPQSNNNEAGETEVKEGFKTLSRGVSKVFKREAKSVGEVTRRIGNGSKKFFKKLGKDISDSFKPDSTTTK